MSLRETQKSVYAYHVGLRPCQNADLILRLGDSHFKTIAIAGSFHVRTEVRSQFMLHITLVS